MIRTEFKNELFVLHLDGELLQPDFWRKYSHKYGSNCLQGWRPPKKVYYKLHHAKVAISHLPEEIRDKVTIVKYIPDETVYL